MSEYTVDTYRYEPETTLPDIVQAAGLATAGLAGAAALGLAQAAGTAAFAGARALIDHFRAQARALEARGMEPVAARLLALDEAPLLRLAVAHESGLGTLPAAQALKPANLHAWLAGAEQRLVAAETTVLQNRIGEALAELGYVRETPRRGQERTSMVRASREEDATSITAKLSPQAQGGRLELDFAGFRGDACQAERKLLTAALGRRGIKLEEAQRQRHQSLAGGALARESEAVFDPLPGRGRGVAPLPTRQRT
jgi:hypothetical protein